MVKTPFDTPSRRNTSGAHKTAATWHNCERENTVPTLCSLNRRWVARNTFANGKNDPATSPQMPIAGRIRRTAGVHSEPVRAGSTVLPARSATAGITAIAAMQHAAISVNWSGASGPEKATCENHPGILLPARAPSAPTPIPSENTRLKARGRSRSPVMAAMNGAWQTAHRHIASPVRNARPNCRGKEGESDRAHSTIGAAMTQVTSALRNPFRSMNRPAGNAPTRLPAAMVPVSRPNCASE